MAETLKTVLRAAGAVAMDFDARSPSFLEINDGLGDVGTCSPAETAFGACLLAHLQLR